MLQTEKRLHVSACVLALVRYESGKYVPALRTRIEGGSPVQAEMT